MVYGSGTGATASTVYIVVAETDNDAVMTGNGLTAIYMWGAQVEAGVYPTSYIPTTTSLQTRQLETVESTTVDWLASDQGGTIYTDSHSADTATTRVLFEVGNNTTNNRWATYIDSADLPALYMVDGGVAQADAKAAAAVTHYERLRCTARVATNDTKAYANGGTGGGDTSCSVPTTAFSKFRIGQLHSAYSGSLNGVMREVRYYTYDKSDDEISLDSQYGDQLVYGPYR
jgi:hypothetical protein